MTVPRLRFGLLLGALMFCTTATLPVFAQTDSLDEQLLDDLDSDLFEGLDDLPKEQPAGANEPSADNPLDEDLLDQLGEGEDIELGKDADPLTRIGEKMRNVEQLIAEQKTSDKTQGLQKKIVEELVALIEQAKKQKKKPSGGKSKPNPMPQRSKVKQPDSQPNNQSNQENKRPDDSTERISKAEAERPDMDELRSLIKEIWGHLPDKAREQMQNSQVEQFLPEYENLIEEYFKRLAEEQRNRP